MSIISYPQTTSQTTGGKYATFDSLANIKNNATGKHAVTKLIKSKSSTPNRPSTISATNFKLNLPTGARVTSIKVEYRHDLQAYNSKFPSINAPTISLLGVSGYSKKGVAPNKNLTTRSITFTPKKTTDFSTAKLNSKDFGVKINYPTNGNTNSGYLRVSFVRITVNYKSPSYTLGWSCNPKQPEQDGTANVSLNVSNKNLNDYTPTLTLTTPAGFTLKNTPTMQNGSTWTKVNNRTYIWKPKFTSKIGSMSLGLSFDVSVTGSLPVSATFEAVESLTGATGSLTVNVVKETPESGEDSDGDMYSDDDTTSDVTVPQQTTEPPEDDYFDYITSVHISSNDVLTFTVPTPRNPYSNEETYLSVYVVSDMPNIEWKFQGEDNWREPTDTESMMKNAIVLGPYQKWEHSYPWEEVIQVRNVSEEWGYLKIRLVNSWGYNQYAMSNLRFVLTQETLNSFTTPPMSILSLSDEELNRLGDGYPYVIQSDMKITTEETKIRNWYKNFRVGVFNNRIESNCTSTLDYYTTDETTNTTINIPITIDTETHNTIEVTASDVILTIDETDYTFNSEETKTISVLSNSFIAVATKNTSDLTEYTIEIEDYTKTYNIHFNAEENKTEEVIHDSTDYSSLTEETIYKNAAYWSSNCAGLNIYNSVECEFPYNKDYPLYCLITGDFVEIDPTNNIIHFKEPCVIEDGAYTNREGNGNYPEPILNIINHDGDTASITIPTNKTSSPIVIYDLDLDEDYGTTTEIAIRGIGVSITIDDYSDCVISAQLKAPTGAIGGRSLILEDGVLDEENNLILGGLGDLWNFSTLDIVDLKNWEVIVTQQNILTNTETTVSAGNVQLIFYVEQITDQKDYCYINGEDLRYYGAFINDIDIPSGLKTDTAFLDIDGTDTNVSYRQNIREKEITIEFEIGDNCDLQTATDSLRQVTQLILNERDSLNRPIPKQIRFSFMPDVYFEYIVENTFDNPIEISSYNIKAKLTVPSGTSYKINSTTTNTTGFVQGLAKVNPTISIKPTGTEIEVTERNSEQKFTIHYTEDTTDGIIVIDTAERKCYLQSDEDSTERTDITKYVDFNSDWIILQGAYVFTGTNCYIRTISYRERW